MDIDDLKAELGQLQYEKVKIELIALAASEDFQTYSDEDEVALQEVEDQISKISVQIVDLQEEMTNVDTL